MEKKKYLVVRDYCCMVPSVIFATNSKNAAELRLQAEIYDDPSSADKFHLYQVMEGE